MYFLFPEGNLPAAGIQNPMYVSDNQNVTNIEREIQRQHRQSNYQHPTPCSQNMAACGVTNDLTAAKNVECSTVGACASDNHYYDDNDVDRYTTLKDFQEKLEDINRTGECPGNTVYLLKFFTQYEFFHFTFTRNNYQTQYCNNQFAYFLITLLTISFCSCLPIFCN
jgi:hypothetical protein